MWDSQAFNTLCYFIMTLQVLWFEGNYYTFYFTVSECDYFCVKEVSRKWIFHNHGSIFSLYLTYVNFSVTVRKKLFKASDTLLGPLILIFHKYVAQLSHWMYFLLSLSLQCSVSGMPNCQSYCAFFIVCT